MCSSDLEVFDATAAADQEFAEIDFFESDFVDKVVALREGKERVEERGGSAALSDDLGEGIAVLFFGAMAVKRELCGREHDSDGGSKIVGSVGGKLTEPRDGGFEPCQELIPGDGEVLDFIFCCWDREAL